MSEKEKQKRVQFDPFQELLNREIDEPFETAIIRRRSPEAVARSPDHSALSLGFETPQRLSRASAGQSQRLLRFETMKKYALFSQMAYAEGDTKKVSEFTNKNPLLNGFVIDTQLSGTKNQVFYNRQTGEIVLAYKGTNPKNMEDIYDDVAIANPNIHESETDRFKRADELYQQVVDKYGSENITITGHSLGGSIAMHVGEKNDQPVMAYNPGVSLNRAFEDTRGNENKTIIFRTGNDPVSFVAPFAQNTNREIITVEQKHMFDSHSISNFTQDKQDPVREAFDVVQGGFDNLGSKLLHVTEQAILKTAHDELIPAEIQENEGVVDKVTNQLVDVLKSDTRRDQDRLMELAESQHKSENIETDIAGDIVSKNGVRYTQVMGDP